MSSADDRERRDAITSQSLNEAKRAFTRTRFIEAALAVFHERGYADTKVEDVVARAGAGRTTFYLYFRNKADLVAAVMDQEMPEAQAHYRALDELGIPSRQDIDRWLRSTVEYWQRKGWIIEIINQAVSVEPTLMPRYAALLDGTIEVMTNYFGRWHADPDEARVQAAALVLQLERICHVWQVRGISFDEGRLLKILGDAWERAMCS